jgi:dolichol-phosphate mannosyltransferase
MRMSRQDKIYVVLPAYNEQGKIGRVVEKVKKIDLVDRIVVVDDCSTDATSEEANAAGATVIKHEKNMGVGAGIRTGINYGRENGFDICLILSGDDQHEPTEIERVVEPIIENKFDFVQGSRRLKGGRVVNDRPFRMITTQLYSLFFSILVLRRITDATNGFRGFRLNIFDQPGIDIEQSWLDRYELEPYILYKVLKNKKIRVTEVPITIYYHGDRKQFTKMKPFRDWWRLARPMIFLGLKIRK